MTHLAIKCIEFAVAEQACNRIESLYGMTQEYTEPLPLIASFAVFSESLGIITRDFVCVMVLHLLERQRDSYYTKRTSLAMQQH